MRKLKWKQNDQFLSILMADDFYDNQDRSSHSLFYWSRFQSFFGAHH